MRTELQANHNSDMEAAKSAAEELTRGHKANLDAMQVAVKESLSQYEQRYQHDFAEVRKDLHAMKELLRIVVKETVVQKY